MASDQRFVKNGLKNSIFCQKAHNFVYSGPYDFIQIPLACSTNIFKEMYGETLDFQCQH